ncbi:MULTISPECIES: MarR family winged helix-turn-helix transcriptional regulator [unclassified Kribbella]|uniref:MarR family winged helix-turn-helix transcriptional regulator n=1 Tax=unclassified Kribbella TaxID=2644121 RepID=UPI00301A5F5D
MYMSDDNKPIGWWLKELDRLLEASFEQVLAADGLTRRQWQALNAAAGPEEIAVALAPFLTEGELSATVDPLAARGWLEGERLTDAGHSALDALKAKVQAHRERVTAGITGEEYSSTIAVLRKMAGNLRGCPGCPLSGAAV